MKIESHSFQSNGNRLDATVFPSDRSGKGVLFVPGWTSERPRSFQYARSLADIGYTCFLVDLSGHGTSEGNRDLLTNKDFLDDVVNSFDYFSALPQIDKDRISAIGSSFGGYLAALLSSRRGLDNLVLRAPADYPNDHFEKLKASVGGDNPEIMEWRSQPRNPDSTFALDAINNFNGRILIIESEKDDRIPHQTIVNYANAIKDQSKLSHVLLKDAPHSLHEGRFRDEVTRVLVDWFQAQG